MRLKVLQIVAWCLGLRLELHKRAVSKPLAPFYTVCHLCGDEIPYGIPMRPDGQMKYGQMN